MQFEGSLGRLTSSSVHNPRQIIDVDAKVIQSDEDPKARELRKFKQLLIHVEKVRHCFFEEFVEIYRSLIRIRRTPWWQSTVDSYYTFRPTIFC